MIRQQSSVITRMAGPPSGNGVRWAPFRLGAVQSSRRERLPPRRTCDLRTGARSVSVAEEIAMSHRPNILFALADDAGMHFGAYGCSWVDTPAFDRVAGEGVLFADAYTCNSKCAPSRAAIITGRNSWQLKDAANHQCNFPAEFRSVFEALAEHGYHTGHTAKGWAPGNPGTVDGKPRELTGPAYNERKWDPPADHINRTDYAANFADFL